MTVLTDFFREEVGSAGRGLGLSVHVQEYVVNVLVDLRMDSLTEEVTVALFDVSPNRTLSLKLAGDSAIVWAGFFPERLRHRAVPEDHCAAVARSAYGQLGRLHSVFTELSVRVSAVLEVLRDVRSSCDLMGQDTPSVLLEWATTGSRASRRRLWAMGLNPGQFLPTGHKMTVGF